MRRYVDLSTTGAPVAEEVAALLGGDGVDCVDAPVSGGPAGAESGQADDDGRRVAGRARRACGRCSSELGSTIFVVGDRPGQGQTAKVINNLMSASAIAITAEAMALGVKAGLDPATLLDVVGASSGSNNAALDKFPKQVLTRRFDHGFRLALMAKDVRLCLDEAERRDVPMLLGGTVDQLWALAARQGGRRRRLHRDRAHVRGLGRQRRSARSRAMTAYGVVAVRYAERETTRGRRSTTAGRATASPTAR